MSTNIEKLRAEQARIHAERERLRRKLEMFRDVAALLVAVVSFAVLLGTGGSLEHGRIGLLGAGVIMAAALVGIWIASECMR